MCAKNVLVPNIDVVRYQCLVENVPDRIIACMKQFPKEAMLQEAGLEAFAVLAGAGKYETALQPTNRRSVCLFV